MTDLVVVGMAYFDVFVPEHIRPAPAEEVFVDSIPLSMGGALNTATVAAALGLEVTLCVPMGNGLVDHAVAALAQRMGIALQPIAARDNPAVSLVFSGSGDRAFVSAAQLDALSTLTQLPKARWVHVPGLQEAAHLEGALARARRDGASISVSGSWSPHRLAALAAQRHQVWDLLVLNEKEAIAACGDAYAAPQRLSQLAQCVVVTLGAAGVLGVLKGVPIRLPAAPAKVVDTTGAGDALCAGLLAGLLRGKSPVAAMGLGVRTGARILEQMGGIVTDAGSLAYLMEDEL